MTSHTDPTVKHDALLLFDAVDSNPNGDPDNAGKPRVDYETGNGIVSDSSLKRKIRDSVILRVAEGMIDGDRNLIFIRRGDSLNEQLEAAYRAVGEEVPKKGKDATSDQIGKATAYMKDHYFDVRMFGAVMSTGNAPADKVTGPVTVGLARSFDPVLPMELGITRTASTKEEAKDNASQMGSKTVIPYGLYAARIHYQPTRDNRVDEQDLDLLWSSIATMFEVTRSAARPSVNVRRLDVFTHDSPLGNAPAASLLDRIVVRKCEGVEQPTRFADYNISGPDEVPSAITHHRLV
jgi:CRISPR-associated protein Csd2